MVMTEAQERVLAVLEPGGMLTVDQIARDAELTKHRTRTAVIALQSRGLVTPCVRSCAGRYQITGRGRGKISALRRRPVTVW